MQQQTATIVQIDIDHGTQWGDKNIVNFIRNTCLPSVKKYCSKHQYEYKLIKHSEYLDNFKNFDFFETKLKHYAFERYFHINKINTDISVYLDNDIFILSNADPLPKINQLMCAREPDGISANTFREINNLPSSYPYYNSGVIMSDNNTSRLLSNYMKKRIINNQKAQGKNTDNMMLNEFIYENKKIFSKLDISWNYMPFLINAKKISNPNFYHFVGIQGKQIIKMINENKFDLEDFLVNAEFNHN